MNLPFHPARVSPKSSQRQACVLAKGATQGDEGLEAPALAALAALAAQHFAPAGFCRRGRTVQRVRGCYRSRAISACSTSVIKPLFASARCRASVVMIGVSGPICSASRTSSGV